MIYTECALQFGILLFAIIVAIVKVMNVGPNIFYNCKNQISLGGQEEKQKVHFFSIKWDELFKNGPSKKVEDKFLRNLKGYGVFFFFFFLKPHKRVKPL